MLAVGSRGDVEPYVALALGLRDAGYDVLLATHARFRALVEERGLAFAELEGDPRALMDDEAGRAWLESGASLLAFWRHFGPLLDSFWDRSVASAQAACVGAEAIVYSALGFAGWHIAEAMGVRAVAAYLQPVTPTRAFPSSMGPPRRRLPGRVNVATHVVAAQAFWQVYRRRTNAWRRDTLGLEPLPFLGPFGRMGRERTPVLYGYSPAVVPRPADWPPWVEVTGYWFTPPTPGWTPPAEVEDFLAAGEAPVVVGFGSMRPRDPARLAETVLAALGRTRRRAIVQAGWAELGGIEGSDQVLAVGELPHGWLFPRARALVHHGGAGTTGAGLRAGRAAAIAPFFADQFFWAARVARLGAGPPFVPQENLTPERLGAAIERAAGDPGLAARAAELGRAIAAEDGVARAVEAFRRHVG